MKLFRLALLTVFALTNCVYADSFAFVQRRATHGSVVGGGSGNITLVSTATGKKQTPSGSSLHFDMGAIPGNNHLIIIPVSSQGGTANLSATSVKDGKGITYALASSTYNAANNVGVYWYYYATTQAYSLGNSSITITPTSGSVGLLATEWEFSGQTASPVDVSSSSFVHGGIINTGTTTVTAADCQLVTTSYGNTTPNPSSPALPPGWTFPVSETDGSAQAVGAFGYRVGPTEVSISTSANYTNLDVNANSIASIQSWH